MDSEHCYHHVKHFVASFKTSKEHEHEPTTKHETEQTATKPSETKKFNVRTYFAEISENLLSDFVKTFENLKLSQFAWLTYM